MSVFVLASQRDLLAHSITVGSPKVTIHKDPLFLLIKGTCLLSHGTLYYTIVTSIYLDYVEHTTIWLISHEGVYVVNSESSNNPMY